MSHFSVVENLMSCFFPEKASSKLIDKSYLKSEPLLFDLLDLLQPPKPSQKKTSKISTLDLLNFSLKLVLQLSIVEFAACLQKYQVRD